MFDKEYSDIPVKEKVELISYQPGLQDSGDLEAGTKTITATAEASGLDNADYSASLTLSKPADARLVVKKICARLAVTIDTIPSGDTNLYCRVYVDAQDADHRLFDLDWTTTGAKLSAVNTHSGTSATIFDLLKDGASHTFYFFFWKAGTGTGIVISCVQLWEGVGRSGSNGAQIPEILKLTYIGMVQVQAHIYTQGTGVTQLWMTIPSNLTHSHAASYKEIAWSSSSASRISSINEQTMGLPRVVPSDMALALRYGSVVTDLHYLVDVQFLLRSEQ